MPDDSGEPAPRQDHRDIEEMWKALLACDWNSLAVIPTDDRVSVQEVVDALQATSGEADPPVRCIDARGVDIADGKRLVRDLATAVAGNTRAVVVVDSLIRSLSGVHLVEEVDAVLLVVRVGAMDLDSLVSTVAIVGAERIMGSVTAPVADWREGPPRASAPA
jgi:hypothetical protein